jgi:hypothetical protein
VSSAANGAIKDEFDVDHVHVTVRHGCTRRDQYELRVAAPIAAHVRAQISARGDARDIGALLVVEVSGVHQITVAAEQGRVVVMPRMTRDRALQRDDMMAVARILAAG